MADSIIRRLVAIEEAIKQLPAATARVGIVAQVEAAFPGERFAEERPRIVQALLAGQPCHFERDGRLYIVMRGARTHDGWLIFDNPALPEPPEREREDDAPALTQTPPETPPRRRRGVTDTRGANWKDLDR
jgi:hypothetical protein